MLPQSVLDGREAAHPPPRCAGEGGCCPPHSQVCLRGKLLSTPLPYVCWKRGVLSTPLLPRCAKGEGCCPPSPGMLEGRAAAHAPPRCAGEGGGCPPHSPSVLEERESVHPVAPYVC